MTTLTTRMLDQRNLLVKGVLELQKDLREFDGPYIYRGDAEERVTIEWVASRLELILCTSIGPYGEET